MFCGYCGHKLNGDEVFCPRCGRRTAHPPQAEPDRGPAPEMAALPRQGSIVPFVMILIVYFFWFFWDNFGARFLVFILNAPSLPSEIVTSTISFYLRNLTTIGLHYIAALAGLAAVLILVGLKKIDPRAFGWKDVVPMAILCAGMPFLPIVLNYFAASLGQYAVLEFSIFSGIVFRPGLPALGAWLLCIAFMLIRSGVVCATWKKALICLGVLIGVSFALAVYHLMTFQNYMELYYSGFPYMEEIQGEVRMRTWRHFIFLWIQWMPLLWFAADSGSKRLPFWGRLLFAAVLLVMLCFYPPVLVYWLGLGITGILLVIPCAYLTAAAVLLVFWLVRIMHAKQRKKIS